jgi:glycosyltransferase involved in cell wall biosynthesis
MYNSKLLKEFPKISIVTPSFNQAEFIESTIQSVLSQNYPNLEYIIIDGGSTDGSVEIIKRYENRLHFWCSEPDAGQYDAIKKGFTYSTGEIMAWLNSDDVYFPWTFKTVASIMSELPQVEWLTTLNHGLWDWSGFCMGFLSIPGFSREAFLNGASNIQQESTFWKRSLWERASSYNFTKFKLAGDFDLWTHLYLYADLYGTPSPLGGFRKQLNQKSRQIQQYLVEAQESLASMQSFFKWSPDFYKNIVYKLKLHRIPKIEKILLPRYGYLGKRVIRRKADSPDSFWDIEEYRFFLG